MSINYTRFWKDQGPTVIEPKKHTDNRGFFSESWNKKSLESIGIDVDFVQDNYSFSNKRFTLRGLHFQAPPYAQAKLVRCSKGALFDVAVDIRQGSPHYGQWVGIELSFQNNLQLFIPEGFLHGFMTLQPFTEISYKCSNFYKSESEITISFDDSDLDIKWPNGDNSVVISDKDLSGLDFNKFNSPCKF